MSEEEEKAAEAAENHPDPNDFAPDFGDDEQDVIFRSQMKVYELFMANWKRLLTIALIFLVGVLIYGLMENNHRDSQRSVHSELATISRSMPTLRPLAVHAQARKAAKSRGSQSSAKARSAANLAGQHLR